MDSHDPSDRPLYDDRRLSKYFDHINLDPEIKRMITNDADHLRHSEAQLDHLHTLQQHQLATVPFENLSLHYSPHHTISLDADDLYDKIVNQRRGGYCMENNGFFGTVLRSLHFRVRSVGARVNEAVSGTGGDGYMGWYAG